MFSNINHFPSNQFTIITKPLINNTIGWDRRTYHKGIPTESGYFVIPNKNGTVKLSIINNLTTGSNRNKFFKKALTENKFGANLVYQKETNVINTQEPQVISLFRTIGIQTTYRYL